MPSIGFGGLAKPAIARSSNYGGIYSIFPIIVCKPNNFSLENSILNPQLNVMKLNRFEVFAKPMCYSFSFLVPCANLLMKLILALKLVWVLVLNPDTEFHSLWELQAAYANIGQLVRGVKSSKGSKKLLGDSPGKLSCRGLPSLICPSLFINHIL